MNEIIDITYKQRELVLRQADILYQNVPDSVKVEMYQEIFYTESLERDEIRKVKESFLGEKAVIEELSIINNYTNKYEAIIKDHFNHYQEGLKQEITESNNVLS